MPIPAQITTDLNNLSTAFNAATPVATAGKVVVIGLQQQADALVSEIDASENLLNAAIDGFVEPTNLPSVAAAVVNHLQNVVDQSNLAEMRGLVGRVASNLNQVVV